MRLLGIDIGATKVDIALLNSNGKIISNLKTYSDKVFEKYSSPEIALAEYIINFCRQTQIQPHDLRGIGIGVPGDIDQNNKKIGTCPNIPILDGVCLAPELTRILDIPVVVENDVNLICLGEYKAGRGVGFKHIACIYVGTGIGCGLILDGDLYVGADGAAGELGHTILVPNGRQCTCGLNGCLEMYCSGKALAIRAATILENSTKKTEPSLDGQVVHWTVAELLIKAAKGGNQAAINELQSAFRYLGIGIANLASIVNPDLIILGGGIPDGWPPGLEIVKTVASQYTRGIARNSLKIEKPVLGGTAGLVGAAYLLQDQLN